jgi:hypothetical protein
VRTRRHDPSRSRKSKTRKQLTIKERTSQQIVMFGREKGKKKEKNIVVAEKMGKKMHGR